MSNQPSQIPSTPQRRLTQDECTWGALAHGSALLNLFSAGFGGVLASGLIWLIYKEKSAWVAFHALQSLLFQAVQLAIVVVGVGGVWVLGFAFSFGTIGFGTILAVPVMILVFFLGFLVLLAGLGYSLYAAYQVGNGCDFRYPIVADWISKKPSF
jgi:uncharacterized protein